MIITRFSFLLLSLSKLILAQPPAPLTHETTEHTTTVADKFKPSPSNTNQSTLSKYLEQDAKLHSFLASTIPSALEHTGSSDFDSHLKGVQSVLRYWKSSKDLTNAGLFHSIYGTEGFQGYALPLSYRSDVISLIGERAERLCWTFCMIDRYTVDEAVLGLVSNRRLLSRPELGRFKITLSDDEWYDFLELTLADWLEQVEGASRTSSTLFHWKKGEAYAYRRYAYQQMAELLSAREPDRLNVTMEMVEAVYGMEAEETRGLIQMKTPPMSEAAERAYEALRSADGDVEVPDHWGPILMVDERMNDAAEL
eukprot:CAMPEP_0195525074 /NCGR_PEP_ID=MMETSP0794_2-20130614/25278_1 /TAXON_ID=515487 /ORGANISM="Stephanopyxis turris, Strain CCMP 815" /LENGTH=309 /DNA_ID=CAMNT_0040655429 /DNA_START=35 /DNA_END=964 /DNA_ORIENTATION=+